MGSYIIYYITYKGIFYAHKVLISRTSIEVSNSLFDISMGHLLTSPMDIWSTSNDAAVSDHLICNCYISDFYFEVLAKLWGYAQLW